jgi:hypothetical protein
MTIFSTVDGNKAFIAAIVALEAQTTSAEDAAFVAEHFSYLYVASQFRSTSRTPTSAPALDESLPPKLRALVGEYQSANEFVLKNLIDHGAFDLAYEEVECGQGKTEWHIRSLVYKDRENLDQVMAVQRKHVEMYDGMSTNTPYILGSQYTDLLVSTIKRGTSPVKSWTTSCARYSASSTSLSLPDRPSMTGISCYLRRMFM